jgi:hypothetical protein
MSNIDDKIAKYVKLGYGQVKIKQTLCIGYKTIHRVCKLKNIYADLKKNNQRSKSRALKTNNLIIRELLYNKYFTPDKQNAIIDFIKQNKCSIRDVRFNFNIPHKQILCFLNKNKDVYDILKGYRRDLCIENAVLNGTKSKITLSNVELKPITQNIVDSFLALKSAGKYKTYIRQYLKENFNFGEKKYLQLCKLYGHPNKNPQIGSLNPMYGRSPSYKAGIGTKSRVLLSGYNLFCRSVLELQIYLYLIENNIKFVQSNHRIKYKYLDKYRTYNPDIVIDDYICEIKPEPLISLEINKVKFEALQKYSNDNKLKCKYITENTYNLEKYKNLEYIDYLINTGIIEIDSINLEKLKRNL